MNIKQTVVETNLFLQEIEFNRSAVPNEEELYPGLSWVNIYILNEASFLGGTLTGRSRHEMTSGNGVSAAPASVERLVKSELIILAGK